MCIFVKLCTTYLGTFRRAPRLNARTSGLTFVTCKRPAFSTTLGNAPRGGMEALLAPNCD